MWEQVLRSSRVRPRSDKDMDVCADNIVLAPARITACAHLAYIGRARLYIDAWLRHGEPLARDCRTVTTLHGRLREVTVATTAAILVKAANATMCLAVRTLYSFFFFQAEDGIRDVAVTGVQTCALPISGLMARITSFTGMLLISVPAVIILHDKLDKTIVTTFLFMSLMLALVLVGVMVFAMQIGRASCRERV